jgi:hypothetical protein
MYMCFLDCKPQCNIVIVYLLSVLRCDYNFISLSVFFIIFIDCNLIINFDKIQMEYILFLHIFIYPTSKLKLLW